jgi:hypothetical protein
LQELRELMLQLELRAMLPWTGQLDLQLHEVAPWLMHQGMQALELALPLPEQESMALLQLRGQLVVFEPVWQRLVQKLRLMHLKYSETQHLHLLAELEPLPPEKCFQFGHKKYLERQLASVLVDLRLKQRHLHSHLVEEPLPQHHCFSVRTGSRSPTLQVLKKDLIGIARTFLLRANRLHRNLVLKTLSAPLRSHFHRPAG